MSKNSETSDGDKNSARALKNTQRQRVWGLGATSAAIVLAINALALSRPPNLENWQFAGLYGPLLILTVLSFLLPIVVGRYLLKRNQETAPRIASRIFIALAIVGLALTLTFFISAGKNASGQSLWFQETFSSYYGWGFFTLNPLMLGFLPAFMLVVFFNAPNKPAYQAALVAVFCECLLLTIFSLEGAICLAMALPLELPMTLLGAWLGIAIGGSSYFPNPKALGSIAVFAPLLVGIGSHVSSPWSTHSVQTYLVVEAPPEKIWPYLLQMSEIGPPGWWLFRAGVAYPVSVVTDNAVLGARRTCVLSTGPMLETIDEIEPGHRLGFRVDSTPPTMYETNPFGMPSPPHLTTTFKCIHGEIELRPLAGGRTLMVGTTVYQQSLAPDFYWSRWCDMVVHEVHSRVFENIERRVKQVPKNGFAKLSGIHDES